MDALSGKNSTGRRVSLLNDGPAPPQLVRLPSITPSLQSRTSSYSSSPQPSPPRLVRSDSSDSNMQTPSPITPDFSYEPGMDSPVFSQNGFFHHQKDLGFPMHHQSGPLPYHANPSQAGYFRPEQLSEQHQDPSALNARPKKNSYPCPMATQRSTLARRMLSAPSATRPLPARTTWSSTAALTRVAATRPRVETATSRRPNTRQSDPSRHPSSRRCLPCHRFPWLIRRFPSAPPDFPWRPPCSLLMPSSTSLPAPGTPTPPTTATTPPPPNTVAWTHSPSLQAVRSASLSHSHCINTSLSWFIRSNP